MASEVTEERRALTILWRIENFNYCKHGFHESGIDSTFFYPHNLDRRLCYLKLFPGSENADKPLLLNFNVSIKEAYCRMNYEWSFLDCNESPLFSVIHRNLTLLCNTSLVLDCSTRKEMFGIRKSSFLPHDTLTVRCRIWKSQVEFEQAEQISTVTRICVGEHSLMWPIEGFSTLPFGQDVTTLVDLDTCYGTKSVQLKFYLTGALLLDSTVNCEIIKDRNCKTELMTVKVSVLDNGQEAIKCWEKILELSRSNVPKFVSRKELMKKKSECLRGDVLTLLCVFTYCTRFNSSIEKTYLGPSNLKRELARINYIDILEARRQTSQQSVDPPDIPREKSDSVAVLLDDFLSLYKDHSLSDFELRSDDVNFPVHKVVLSARSPVFKAMFSSDMKESFSNFLDVPDVDAHALNRMLTFLYAGTVDPLQWEGAIKLYYAADKYQIPSLKQHCTLILRSGITVSNVSDILTFADRHLDQELTSFVHDFILSHYDEIMRSDEWENFLQNDPFLPGKTMHQLYKRKFKLMDH